MPASTSGPTLNLLGDPRLAPLLEDCVVGVRRLMAATDGLLAALEEGLGQPSTSRPLDLALGALPQEEPSVDTPLTVGSALARAADGKLAWGGGPYDMDLSQLLGTTARIEQRLAWGSMWLVADITDPDIGGRSGAVEFTLSLPAGAEDGDPPLMAAISDSFGAVEALAVLQAGRVSAAPPPASASNPNKAALEVARFVLVVESWDPDTEGEAVQAVSAQIDLSPRRVRGFGGFCEEALAGNSLPALSRTQREATAAAQAARLAVRTLVGAWAASTDWAPSFVTYWQDSDIALPPNLQDFLARELAIEV